MPHAIIRGKNGRRHEVDFGDAPIRVEIYASDETVEIFVEADFETHAEERRRFAILNIPRNLELAVLPCCSIQQDDPTSPNPLDRLLRKPRRPPPTGVSFRWYSCPSGAMEDTIWEPDSLEPPALMGNGTSVWARRRSLWACDGRFDQSGAELARGQPRHLGLLSRQPQTPITDPCGF